MEACGQRSPTRGRQRPTPLPIGLGSWGRGEAGCALVDICRLVEFLRITRSLVGQDRREQPERIPVVRSSASTLRAITSASSSCPRSRRTPAQPGSAYLLSSTSAHAHKLPLGLGQPLERPVRLGKHDPRTPHRTATPGSEDSAEQLAKPLIALLDLAHKLLHEIANLIGQRGEIAIRSRRPTRRCPSRRTPLPSLPRGGRSRLDLLGTPTPGVSSGLATGGAIVVGGDGSRVHVTLLGDLLKRLRPALPFRAARSSRPSAVEKRCSSVGVPRRASLALVVEHVKLA